VHLHQRCARQIETVTAGIEHLPQPIGLRSRRRVQG
jgi:hypothetical protein